LARIPYSVNGVNLSVSLTLIDLLVCRSEPFPDPLGMWRVFMVLTLAISHGAYEVFRKRINDLRDGYRAGTCR
jgi:hypothetical protein